eukprot:357392-Chlamydomonas_euryale.AAC.50
MDKGFGVLARLDSTVLHSISQSNTERNQIGMPALNKASNQRCPQGQSGKKRRAGMGRTPAKPHLIPLHDHPVTLVSSHYRSSATKILWGCGRTCIHPLRDLHNVPPANGQAHFDEDLYRLGKRQRLHHGDVTTRPPGVYTVRLNKQLRVGHAGNRRHDCYPGMQYARNATPAKTYSHRTAVWKCSRRFHAYVSRKRFFVGNQTDSVDATRKNVYESA